MPRDFAPRFDRRPPEAPAERGLVPGPADDLTVVAVRSNGQHPLMFRKMVIGPVRGPRPSRGALVRVVDRDGLQLGFGLWNDRSEIPVRLIARGDTPPDADFWHRRLDQAVALRRDTLGLDAVTNAYRVLHAEGDGLSGLIVDRFDDVLSVEAFSLGMLQRGGPLLEHLSKALGTSHYLVRMDDWVADAEGYDGGYIASEGLPSRVAIQEHGVRYRVQFDTGHKTGFFCDQRDNRRDLAAHCKDRDVLDLCCYTGGFGLNARLRGGAREVTCVDLDEDAIAVARANANLNQTRLNLVHADAFGYARQMGANGKQYGVVVLDPPKLIADRTEIAQGKRKYFDLNRLAMDLVEPGGLMLTCSCSGILPVEEFIILLRAAARLAGRSAQVLAVTGAAADHPVDLQVPEGAYLKAVWLRLGDSIAPEPSAAPDPDAGPAAE